VSRARTAAVAVVALASCLAAPRRARAQNVEGLTIECGTPTDDDPSTREARAREHFARAAELYTNGDYELAIPEYEAVLCLVPLPQAAHNIAQAYLSLVDYEHAVAWFEYEIRLLPDSEAEARRVAQNRVNRLRALPARVLVATDPPGAAVTFEGAQNKVTGTSSATEPLRLPAGDYTMRVELAGYTPVVTEVHLRIGQPYTYSYQLEQKTGRVNISVDPLSARIFVDKRLVAQGSFVDDLPVGPHTVMVEAVGRTPIERPLTVRAEGTSTLHVDMPAPPKSGRWELIAATSAFGAIAGGTLGDQVLGQGSSGTTLFLVGGLGVGFAGAYFGAERGIPVGQTSYIIGSAAWGAGEGLGLGELISPGGKLSASLAVAGMMTGVLGGALTADRLDLSAGDAAMLNSGAMWGTTGALMLYSLFALNEKDFGGFVLGGLNVGLLAGGALAYKTDYTRGHVALIDLSGVGGAVVGLALANVFLDSSSSTANANDTKLHFALAGTGLGLVVGSILTRHMDEQKARPGLRAMTPVFDVASDADGRRVNVVGVGGIW
jgi:hypothetical protein